MERRTALAVLAGLVGLSATGYSWHRSTGRADRADRRMRADFADGRVYTSDSWYLSAYEVETLELDDARSLHDG